MDLVIRGGTVVTSGDTGVTDIGIEDGRVAQLGGTMSALEELDATGRYVLPGGVDMHVHLTPPATGASGWQWVDDFESGTRAALAGGVTTVGNITFPERGQSLTEAMERDRATATELSTADYVLHPVVMEPTPAVLDEITVLAKEGHTSIKIFLSFRRFDRHVGEYLEAMRRTKAAGGLAMIHCEDAAIMDCCCVLLREEGKTEPRYYPDSRPILSEVVATQRAISFAETTGCPIYVVHLAAGEALDACRAARRQELPVYVETRPLYLHLTRERYEEQDGAKYAGAPPLREQPDRDAMWAGIRFADIDTLCTDHAPWMLADKLDPDLDACELRQGMADLETCMPMLWSEGVETGRISLRRFVEATSTNAAKLFGLYPQKGTVAVGSDADLVIWDAEETRVIDGESMETRADHSVYDGWSVTGWPTVTISRGEVVMANGEVTASPGRGQLIARHAPELY